MTCFKQVIMIRSIEQEEKLEKKFSCTMPV